MHPLRRSVVHLHLPLTHNVGVTQDCRTSGHKATIVGLLQPPLIVAHLALPLPRILQHLLYHYHNFLPYPHMLRNLALLRSTSAASLKQVEHPRLPKYQSPNLPIMFKRFRRQIRVVPERHLVGSLIHLSGRRTVVRRYQRSLSQQTPMTLTTQMDPNR